MLACIPFTLVKAQAPVKRNNVLLIYADDMNNKVDYLGSPAVLTPNLQRLLQHGTAFTKAYCQFAICNPSRVSMMSGWRPDKTKIFSNATDPKKQVPNNVQYLQDYFHSFGYRTERYGKIYHGQFEYEFNWDFAENYTDTSDFDANAGSITTPQDKTDLWGILKDENFTNPDSLMATRLVASLNVPYEQPRFMAIGLTSTHSPFTPNLTYWNLYGKSDTLENLLYWHSASTVLGNSAQNILLPNTPANDRDDIPAAAFFLNSTIPVSDSEWRSTVQAYYGEVSILDKNLGILLDALDSKNMWDSTVVVFVSDHGQHLGEHGGMWYKNSLFNESMQVPLIVCAPGKPAAICNNIVELVDVYPTLTELCKLPTPANMEGSGFVRLLHNPNQPWKKAAYTQTRPGASFPLVTKAEGIYTNEYHYNYWGPYGEELYDRLNDPNEYNNLAIIPEFVSALDSLRNIRINGYIQSLPPACDSVLYYADKDGDGFGGTISQFKGCYQPIGYVTNNVDCNDSLATISPNAIEICDGIDNNCNGLVDENGIMPVINQGITATVCSGSSIVLSANSDNVASFQWYKNGVAITGATSATLIVTQAGSYSVKETTAEGCSAFSAKTTVSTASRPTATITALGNLNICASGSVLLEANSGAGLTYQWKKGSTLISGATGIQYTATSIGTYYVVVTNSSNCNKQSTGVKVTKTCFAGSNINGNNLNSATEKAGAIAVYPNPANNLVTVQYLSNSNNKANITVYDITGKAILTNTVNAIKGSNNFSFNVGNAAAGVYYVEVNNNNEKQRVQFLVAH
ncbi:sulfatase-like hydrolase/transferase [Limnovirga soli]|nr:sulfatase-like hydrolase/transferase [Limnovirga soli]